MIHRAADLQATAEMKVNIFLRGKLRPVSIYYVDMMFLGNVGRLPVQLIYLLSIYILHSTFYNFNED